MEKVDFNEPVTGELHVLGQRVSCSVTIKTKYDAYIDFTYNRKPYTFEVTQWSGRGQANFLDLFHTHQPRDSTVFGSLDEDGSYQGNMVQKMNCVTQACLDIMSCLSRVAEKNERFVLDYAVWYRETQRQNKLESYAKYITVITCHCIVHSDFMAGNVRYELVEFQ